MAQISGTSFGVVIAFLLPGFVALCGASVHSVTLAAWLLGSSEMPTATFGGFLFSTLAALFLGLLCSTGRWLLVDSLHHWTGVRSPRRDFRRLQANLDAYRLIEANHYQFYQFYANSLVAWIASYLAYRFSHAKGFDPWSDSAAAAIAVLLFLGSRDTLRKYYDRIDAVLKDSTLILPLSSQYRETACSEEFRGR